MAVLSIGGLDPSGSAGVLADMLTLDLLGIKGSYILTAKTQQDEGSFYGVEPILKQEFTDSLNKFIEGHDKEDPLIVKTGMIYSNYQPKMIRELAEITNAVLIADPVLSSSTGADLIEGSVVLDEIKKEIFPNCCLITPNLPEASIITAQTIKNNEDIKNACQIIHGQGPKVVVLKGGHGNLSKNVMDTLFHDGSWEFFEKERMDINLRGTGCFLASLISGLMDRGNEAIWSSRESIKFMAKVFETMSILPKSNDEWVKIDHELLKDKLKDELEYLVKRI